MNRRLTYITILILLLTSCIQRNNFRNSIDHWEIIRTFNIHNNSKLEIDIEENLYRVVSGQNQVLIITIEKNPVFKKGKELTDLHSTKSLLLELDTSDKIVTANKPLNSKLLRRLVAFSPKNGIKPLEKDEKLTLTKKDETVWTIDSDVEDFVFYAELDFSKTQTLTDYYNDY